MNILFWLIVAAMIVIALLIVLPPLWRENKTTVPDDRDQRNIRIARERLADLKANKAAGGISQAQFDEQVTELELALSDDLDAASSSGTPQTQNPKQGRWLAYLLVIAIPLLSGGLYWTLGTFQAVSHSDELNQAGSETPNPELIGKMVAGLAEKLKANPDNLDGWLMLGRSYKVLQRYPEAVDAMSHAYQLAGEKADVMLAYAEALALANNNNWAGKPDELVAKALVIEPENLNGLWFASMASAQQGDKLSAIGYLRKLEALLPPDAPDKQQLHDLIANTEGQLANNPSEQAAPEKSPEPSVATGKAVSVEVSLADKLQKDVNPQDTVFVYAQALGGPKMPLAIVRKQVKDLPLSVTLTDAQAMMPSMKLSNFKEVRLLARISKSGSAMPQTGDLIGTVEQASVVESKGYKIVIADQVK